MHGHRKISIPGTPRHPTGVFEDRLAEAVASSELGSAQTDLVRPLSVAAEGCDASDARPKESLPTSRETDRGLPAPGYRIGKKHSSGISRLDRLFCMLSQLMAPPVSPLIDVPAKTGGSAIRSSSTIRCILANLRGAGVSLSVTKEMAWMSSKIQIKQRADYRACVLYLRDLLARFTPEGRSLPPLPRLNLCGTRW
jgi:hypothetical protein